MISLIKTDLLPYTPRSNNSPVSACVDDQGPTPSNSIPAQFSPSWDPEVCSQHEELGIHHPAPLQSVPLLQSKDDIHSLTLPKENIEAWGALATHHSPPVHLNPPTLITSSDPTRPPQQVQSLYSLSADAGHSVITANPSGAPPPGNFERNRAQSPQTTGSMQTPPPTAASAEKRKGRLPQESTMSFSETIRTMGSPEQRTPKTLTSPGNFLSASPHMFGPFSLSPATGDTFQFSSAGPATAPVYPQEKLFWDSSTSFGAGPLDLHEGDVMDINMNDSTREDFIFDWGQDGIGEAEVINSLIESSQVGPSPTTTHQAQTGFDKASDAAIPFKHKPSSLSRPGLLPRDLPTSFNASGSVVNPTLLLSNSSPAKKSFRNETVPQLHSITKTGHFQPYQHQIEESKREQEFAEARRARLVRVRRSGEGQQFPGERLRKVGRPALQRSVTDTAPKSVTTLAHDPRTSGSIFQIGPDGKATVSRLEGRRSPIRNRGNGLDSLSIIPEGMAATNRTAVTFRIDADGRAKTEARLLSEDQGPGEGTPTRMEVDEEWDDAESESSTDSDFDIAVSRKTSFNFGRNPSTELQTAKYPLDNSFASKRFWDASRHEYNEPKSGTSSYGSSPRLPQTQNEQRKHARLASVSTSNASAISSTDPDSDGETILDDDGAPSDAQLALRQMVEKRKRKKGKTSSNT